MSKLRRDCMEQKEHFKSYKTKKGWMFACITALLLAAGLSTNISKTKADTAKTTVGTVVNQAQPLYDQFGTQAQAVRSLSKGSQWKVFSGMIDLQNQQWFNLGTNEWVRDNEMDLQKYFYVPVYHAAQKPVITLNTDMNLTSGYGNQAKNIKKLPKGSAWVVSKIVRLKGVEWYQIGNNQWVSGAANVTQTGDFTNVVFDNQDVPYVAVNYQTVLFQNYGANANGIRTLPAGSTWRVYSVVDLDGTKWYNAGQNQWIEIPANTSAFISWGAQQLSTQSVNGSGSTNNGNTGTTQNSTTGTNTATSTQTTGTTGQSTTNTTSATNNTGTGTPNNNGNNGASTSTGASNNSTSTTPAVPQQTTYTIKYVDADGNSIPNVPNQTLNGTVGQAITAPTAQTIKGYTFQSMSTTSLTLGSNAANNVITYTYKKDTPPASNATTYTIKYVDQNGNPISGVADESHQGTVGGVITAPTTAQDAKPITGYVFDKASATSIKLGSDAGKNVITLIYKQTARYTIKYVDESGQLIANAPKGTGIGDVGDTEAASKYESNIAGYTFDKADKDSITLGSDASQNVITLTYKKNAQPVGYTIKYVDDQGNAVTGAPEGTEQGNVGDKVDATKFESSITGYSFEKADKDSITLGSDASQNVITLTYTKITQTVNYSVDYVLDGHPYTSIDGLKNETKTGKVGDTITETAPAVAGFYLTNDKDATQKLTLTNNPDNNVITFHYTMDVSGQGYDYTVKYVDADNPTKEIAPELQGRAGSGVSLDLIASAPKVSGYTVVTTSVPNIVMDPSLDNKVFTVEYKRNKLNTSPVFTAADLANIAKLQAAYKAIPTYTTNPDNYSSKPNFGTPFSAGTPASNYQDAVLQSFNFYRTQLFGLSPVTYNQATATTDQMASVGEAAAITPLGHFITGYTKPTYMSDTDWNTTVAAGLVHSNLQGLYSGMTVDQAMESWLADNDNSADQNLPTQNAGHRLNMLQPGLGSTGSGFAFAPDEQKGSSNMTLDVYAGQTGSQNYSGLMTYPTAGLFPIELLPTNTPISVICYDNSYDLSKVTKITIEDTTPGAGNSTATVSGNQILASKATEEQSIYGYGKTSVTAAANYNFTDGHAYTITLYDAQGNKIYSYSFKVFTLY